MHHSEEVEVYGGRSVVGGLEECGGRVEECGGRGGGIGWEG